ncbi:hypothetical protein ACFYOI_14845 [Streptomyces microflavus]|uniref:hypothetical protein n=1 Tax=Streptomyces microflavus TaxID=1919 RepID=UPI0033ADEEAB
MRAVDCGVVHLQAATENLETVARRAAADRRPDYRDVLAPVVQALACALVGCGEHPRAVGLLHHRSSVRHHHTYEDFLHAAP